MRRGWRALVALALAGGQRAGALSITRAAAAGVVHRAAAARMCASPPRSVAEYEASLDAAGALPAGFRVGTCGFSFSPEEAPSSVANMNLTVIVLDEPTEGYAACFTRNAFCGSPVTVGRARLAAGAPLQAIVVNNKISNVCAAGDGVAVSEAVCAAAADALGLAGGAASVIPCSTGVIGWRYASPRCALRCEPPPRASMRHPGRPTRRLPLDAMVNAIPAAVGALQRTSAVPAARGIMTTDRYPKLRSRKTKGGATIVGFAKVTTAQSRHRSGSPAKARRVHPCTRVSRRARA